MEDVDEMEKTGELSVVALVLEVEEPEMTPKIIHYLVECEACLELASFIALPATNENEERIQDAMSLERSYRAARALGATGEMLLPFFGGGDVVTKLAHKLLYIFSPKSIGSLHHGCHVLMRLLQMYPDEVYQAFMMQSEVLARLLKLVDADGNCLSLLLELCAPGSKAAFEVSDDGSEDEEDDDENTSYLHQKQEPSAKMRWQFVQHLTKYHIVKEAAIECPRSFIDLCDRISRDKNGELLLQPIAHDDIHTIFLQRLVYESHQTSVRIDAARAILAAARIGLRRRTSAIPNVAGSTEDANESGIVLPPGIVLVRSTFRKLIASSALDTLANVALHEDTPKILKFHILEILLECIYDNNTFKLNASFWVRAVHTFCSQTGLCSGIFLEVWLLALQNHLVDDDTIMAVAHLSSSFSDTAIQDPRIMAVFAASHFARPTRIHLPNNLLRILSIQASSRYFHGPVDPFAFADNDQIALTHFEESTIIYQEPDSNTETAIIRYAEALGFDIARQPNYNRQNDTDSDDSEPREISRTGLRRTSSSGSHRYKDYRDDDDDDDDDNDELDYDSEDLQDSSYSTGLNDDADNEENYDEDDDDDVLIDDDGLRPMTMEEDDDYSIDDQDHQQKPSTSSHTSAERHPTPPTNPYPSLYYSPFVHQKDDEDLNDLNISVMAQS